MSQKLQIHIGVGEELRLEVLGEQHVEELFEAVDANREYLAEWLPWVPENTEVDDTRQFVEFRQKVYRNRRALPTAINYRGRIAGTVGMDVTDPDIRAGEIGYWLVEDLQGRGIVTRSVRAMLDVAFGLWRMHRIVIRCAPENARSCAIPERLGFTLEGTERDGGKLGDDYYNLNVYSLLEHEWPRN